MSTTTPPPSSPTSSSPSSSAKNPEARKPRPPRRKPPPPKPPPTPNPTPPPPPSKQPTTRRLPPRPPSPLPSAAPSASPPTPTTTPASRSSQTNWPPCAPSLRECGRRWSRHSAAPDPRTPPTPRLWLVGLILESNGDTQAAAESLLRIVNAPSSQTPDPVAPELAQQARDEARRLSQAPKRSVILDEIIALRDALESSNLSPDSETSDSLIGGLASFLRGAFSVSRRDADGESALEQMRTHAARMEFYIASNNRRLYLRALDETARLWAELESVGGDPAVGARVSRLRELGAPDYRLNLPLSKP